MMSRHWELSTTKPQTRVHTKTHDVINDNCSSVQTLLFMQPTLVAPPSISSDLGQVEVSGLSRLANQKSAHTRNMIPSIFQ